MLKHASPQRSSSSLAQHLPPSHAAPRPSDTCSCVHVEGPSSQAVDFAFRDSYSERSVDCDSLIVPASYAQAERQAGYQVGTWTGVSQANVRRGLSFSSRRAPDALSFRSVRSEGKPASLALMSPSKMPQSSTSMLNVSTIRSDGSNLKSDKERPESNFQYLKGDMSSLKNLLRLPGVRGPAKIIELSKDGVLLSPDSLSLNSSDSFFTANTGRTSSRSWSSNASSNSSGTNASSGSNSSTSEPASTTIRVFAKCLRSDIEYKTISVSSRATCREVVALLLSKYRMRHRDPNLFYLTMEVTVRRWSGAPVRSLLVLEDGARPAQLALCRPPGDSRFALQMRRGGVVKVHDTLLMPGSQYKSLLVSDRTTAEEVVQLLLNCYNRRDNKYYYAIHEVRRNPQYSDRMILPEERLLDVKAKWPRDRQAEFVFVLRRNMSQALSLRRLSLRTSDVKRPPVDFSGREEDRHFPSTQVLPAWRTNAPPLPKADDQVHIIIVEEAVIDCTDVTPKMTTINRATTTTTTNPGCKGTAEVFPSTTTTTGCKATAEVYPNTTTSCKVTAEVYPNTTTSCKVTAEVYPNTITGCRGTAEAFPTTTGCRGSAEAFPATTAYKGTAGVPTTTAGCKGTGEVFPTTATVCKSTVGVPSTTTTTTGCNGTAEVIPTTTGCKGTAGVSFTTTSAEAFPGKTSAEAAHTRPPAAQPVSEAVVGPVAASSTRDNATNTEAKMWSNTSTQTIVSGQVSKSASASRDQQRPQPSPEIRDVNPSEQNPGGNVKRSSSEESKSLTTRIASQDPQGGTEKATSETPRCEDASKVSSDNPTDRERPSAPNPRSGEASDSFTTPLKTQVNESSLVSSSPTDVSVTARPDVRHKCKHNCQHCFYI